MRNFISLSLLALATSVFAQDAGSPPAPESSPASSFAAESSASSSSVATTSSATPAAAPSSTPPVTPAQVETGTISAGCANFLSQLNSNAEIAACLGPQLAASTGAVSQATLDGFCKTKGCSDTTIRSQLTGFGDACQQELTGPSPVATVIQLYDVLYTINPMREAVCSKDGGQYCLAKIQSAQPAVADAIGRVKSEGLNAGSKAINLSGAQVVMSQTPNPAVWRAAGIANLFTLPDLPAEALCTPCTISILNAYNSFGAAHALGAANSLLVGGQVPLWKAIGSKCDASFTKEIFDSRSFAVTSPNGAASVSSNVAGLVASVFVVAASAWLSL